MTNTVTRALPEIQFSPGIITLQPDGSYVFPIGGTFPTEDDGGGQYVLDVNIISSTTSNGGNGGGPTGTSASFQGTELTPLTPGEILPGTTRLGAGIGVGGGSAQFRLVADGTWEIRDVEITLAGQGTMTSDTGSFREEYTTATDRPDIIPPLTFTQSGSIGPLTGGAGEHIITLTVDAMGYDSRIIGNTPTPFFPDNWNVVYFFTVIGVGTVKTGSTAAFEFSGAVQSGTYGSANIVLPGFQDANLMSFSTETGAENLLFFG